MKKFITLLLAAVMSVSMFTACSKPAEEKVETTTPVVEEVAGVDLTILKEADEKMLNTYTVIAVNPEAPFTDADGNAVSDVAVNTAGADALINWLLLAETADVIAKYGEAEYGNTLFYNFDVVLTVYFMEFSQ